MAIDRTERDETSSSKESPWILVTGVPELVARDLCERLLAHEAGHQLALVVSEAERPAFDAWMAELDAGVRERVVVFEGCPWAIDMGLSREEFWTLAGRVSHFFHWARTTDPRLGRAAAEERNVGAMREVIEFGRVASQLELVVMLSSARVSGDRKGLVLEAELEHGQKFLAPVEETLAVAERMARQVMDAIPIVILRPSVETCLSLTGEPPPDSPLSWLFGVLLHSPQDLPLLVPARREVPFNVVPLDFVNRVAVAIAWREDAIGRTLHLTDPHPPTVGELLDQVSERIGRRPPSATVPPPVSRVLFNAAGWASWARGPLFLAELMTQVVTYDTYTTGRLLRDVESGEGALECPTFRSYVDAYVDFVRHDKKGDGSSEDEAKQSS